MPDEERMTIEERYKYLRAQRRRYEKADRGGKSKLLDEMEAVTGLHRKSLIRLLAGEPRRKKRRQERGHTYDEAVGQAVLYLAETLDWICAERLTPSLPWVAALLMEQGELELEEAVIEKLGEISAATVRRILACVPKERWRLPQRSPRPNPLARQVAVERIRWDVGEAGHMEMDLVHHSGRSSEGEYLHTLQMVDVATGWSELEVVPGRSYFAVTAALGCILDRLPFPVVEVHCDNGAEFLNHHLLRYLGERLGEGKLTRSRPYHKNDSRYVEQKNSSLVRAYVGYQRLDSPAQAKTLSRVYRHMRLYYNLYQPVMHLVEKSYVNEPGGGTKVKRRYDQATTPLDRLIALGALDGPSKEQWLSLRRATNPRRLREQIYALLEELRSLPGGSGLGDVRVLMASLAMALDAETQLLTSAVAVQ
ncbi:MAG: transposase family protein [Dehalococcoidia bacterium]|nr:transposase family protein [Dehalococcoidia bacterium]